jgi:intron-binding protein aquarius
MTCTHAALKRREFLNLGLKYDNIVMEEAGQVRVGVGGGG